MPAVLAACGGDGGDRAARRAALKPGQTIRVLAAGTPSRRFGCALERRRFRTLPALKPVGFCLARRRGVAVDDDLLLVTPRPDPRTNKGEQFGTMILSGDGKLLWYAAHPDKVHDLKVVETGGRRLLAYWQRRGSTGGYYQLLDERYRPAGRIVAGRGFPTNLHELQVTGRTAWISADVKVRPRGSRRTVIEYVVQEVDVETGKVLFEWRSSKHVPPGDSYERAPAGDKAWDYFHGNSIAPPTAEYPTAVISSRNTSSLYGVDPRTGRTKWILGGKRDQFGLDEALPGYPFCAQHDVHRLPNGDLMLFDNGGTYMHGEPRCPVHPARVLVLRVDEKRKRVKLVRSISSTGLSANGKGYFPGWVGGARLMSDGATLIDWGPNRRITAVDRDGRVDLLLRVERWSYRANPARWTGKPGGRPAIATRRRGATVDVWASWNGATEIRAWQVLAGPSPQALQPVGAPARFADLETRLVARTSAPYVAVRALDADGETLGRSRAVRTGS